MALNIPTQVKEKTTQTPAPVVEEVVEAQTNAMQVVAQPTTMTVAAQPGDDTGFSIARKSLGFGSFPMVKLENGDFIFGETGVSLQEFDAVLTKMREKLLIKARSGGERGIPIVFAYAPTDGTSYTVEDLISSDGSAVGDHIASWKEAGEMPVSARPVVSSYYEILAQIHNTDTEMDGELAILNVPPASQSGLSGYIERLAYKRLTPPQVLTKVIKGPKRTNANGTYYPWAFKLAGKLGED